MLGCFFIGAQWVTQRREMRDGVREAGRNVRGLGVFRLVKRCVCTFFFFFFFWISAWLGRFGRFGRYRPIWPIRTESARFWPRRGRFPPNRRRLQPRRPDSGLATWYDVVRRGTDARSAASLPRPAASDAGAPALGPRPCIPDIKWKMCEFLLTFKYFAKIRVFQFYESLFSYIFLT